MYINSFRVPGDLITTFKWHGYIVLLVFAKIKLRINAKYRENVAAM